MLTVDALKEFGANTDEGLGRCLNNEQFYLRLVKMSLEDGSFEKLAAALECGDTKGAFEAAHALKGVMGNLALTPIYTPASELTELLRSGMEADYNSYLEAIRVQRDRLSALCL